MRSARYSPGRLIPTHAGKTSPGGARRLWRRAHPHSRGENKLRLGVVVVRGGSSPLTRGKRRLCGPALHGDRLIPTHAGKTVRRRRYPRAARAHPHSRGENKKPEHAVKYSGGSSPLTRGKHSHRGVRGHRLRLIPTHAGKTVVPRISARRVRAHPHSRGENAAAMACSPMSRGSSPLTRGKRQRPVPGAWRGGLIPTHAGKTNTGHTWSGAPWAHPHSRGEN